MQKNIQFKTVCNVDMVYVTQLARQKRCYYFGSSSP